MVRDTPKALSWEIIPHLAYSPDLTPSEYRLFASMSHALAEQRFGSYEEVKKWLDEWFAAKGDDFYWRFTDIHKLPERLQRKMYNKRWSIFWITPLLSFFRI